MNLEILNSKEFIIFRTKDYSLNYKLSLSAASQRLKRLEEKQLLTRITRSIWANTKHPYFTKLAIVPYILGVEQGYISFFTALHIHGLISQIPPSIQIASTGHARKLSSPVGNFEFIQIKPQLMQDGFELSDSKLSYPIADLEKALLDCLYISSKRNNRFSSFPELDFEETEFDDSKFMKLLELVKNPKIKNHILTRFYELKGGL